ncbi:hypothetical protein N657DRAFT_150675 [Parathielavia appendiculata]|uniref:non-specific serine/threonine protein kinase n=1 Tax=Parathielavia appendiculata TaxID=2587402 RepID=A0AAN6Z0R2_9PEZI|nr:hypothetical protein N657DRAFT_150675 [Parathielavia appendiculata]
MIISNMAANMEILPVTVFQRDVESEKTEHLQWYGTGKLHPTHLGDMLDNGRYTIVHKLDHDRHSLSWLARDNLTHTWRRIDIAQAFADIHEQHGNLRAVTEHLLERAAKGNDRADNKGLAVAKFTHHGPNGAHLCMVFPLQGAMNCFRWGVRDECAMNAGWFMRRCARLRAENGGGEPPESVHDITRGEMLRILGRPRVLRADAQLRRIAGVENSVRLEQLPRYLVVRPDRIEDELDFWLSPEAFERCE